MKLFRSRKYLDDAGREIEIGIIGNRVLLTLEKETCHFSDWCILLQIGSVGFFYLTLSLGRNSYTMNVLGKNYG